MSEFERPSMPYQDRQVHQVPLYSSSYTADFTLDADFARQRAMNNLRLLVILGLGGLFTVAFATLIVALMA